MPSTLIETYITSDYARANPEQAFDQLSGIITSGDTRTFRDLLYSDVDITSLKDTNGRNLMHIAMLSSSPNQSNMVSKLINHVGGGKGDSHAFISALDNDGLTPRDMAREFELHEAAEMLDKQGALSASDYAKAKASCPRIQLLSNEGKVVNAELHQVPQGYEWAEPAMKRIHLDLAGVAARMPELTESFVTRGGYFVITQGEVNQFDVHVLKHTAKATQKGFCTTAQAYILNENTHANVFCAPLYTHAMNYGRNIVAHELTHTADAVGLKYGRHSKSPLFALVVELDDVLEGPVGIIGHNKAMITAADSYKAHPEVEYFARVSNHLNSPLHNSLSPLLAAYQQIVLRPTLKLQRDKNSSALAFLETELKQVNPQVILGEDNILLIETYKTAKRSYDELKQRSDAYTDICKRNKLLIDPKESAMVEYNQARDTLDRARIHLVKAYGDIVKRVTTHMKSAVANGHKRYCQPNDLAEHDGKQGLGQEDVHNTLLDKFRLLRTMLGGSTNKHMHPSGLTQKQTTKDRSSEIS